MDPISICLFVLSACIHAFQHKKIEQANAINSVQKHKSKRKRSKINKFNVSEESI